MRDVKSSTDHPDQKGKYKTEKADEDCHIGRIDEVVRILSHEVPIHVTTSSRLSARGQIPPNMKGSLTSS